MTTQSRVENLRSSISQHQQEKERLEGECTILQRRLQTAHQVRERNNGLTHEGADSSSPLQDLENEKRERDSIRQSHREALNELTKERDVLAKQLKSLKNSLEEEREQRKGEIFIFY